MAGAAADLRPEFASAHYNLACIHALLAEGKTDPAASATPVSSAEAAHRRDAGFAHLRRSLALGFADLEHLRTDPDLVSLHGDPRWEELLRR